MTQALTITTSYGLPSPHEMAVFSTMAKQAVSSRMYRGLGEESGVMMIMLAAREFGIPAMQALNGGLNIINGKVELSARMIGALIYKAGHTMTIRESTENACTIAGTRTGGPSLEVSYTLAEARTAGLIKPGGGWTKNPKDMCYARAVSRLARQLFPDVIGIGYVHGEISECTADLHEPEPEIEISQESEESLIEKYKSFFNDPDDKNVCMTYLNTVIAHFKWTMRFALEKMLKNPEGLVQSYHIWKNKNHGIDVQDDKEKTKPV